ncbi:MAG: ADP-heptose--LPS heptosyltransferase 2 [Gemmatimonadaceae bacterium]|nr:ADP-heptose--LPS heptosyltransferase 2 [Gemmatimonadaceae bacterium]
MAHLSLVVQTSFLGDVVLATPLLAQLATDGPVDVVTTPAAAGLLANHPAVRRVIVYDKRGTHSGVGGLAELSRAIRAPDRSAIAYCAQGSLRTAALALAAGYRTRIGFDRSAGRWLYTSRVAYRREQHHVERLWRLAAGSGAVADPAALLPRLYPGDDDRARVSELLVREASPGGEPLIALAPGSVWATKRWPYYLDLARRLTSAGQLVVVGGAADRDIARAIVDATFGAAIDATGCLSLLQSAELIGRCALLITNDSAPQHLASAMRTPTVAIFGSTVPALGFGPLAPQSAIVEHLGLDCRPCNAHGPVQCPLGHWRCMRDLDADRVAQVAMRLANARER